METEGVATREEVLWRVDSIVTWEAPDCELPEAFRGPELNMLVGRGMYKIGEPRHSIRVGFEVNAPDEATALRLAQEELIHDFKLLDKRHGDSGAFPQDVDIHPDRIVLDRLAVRRVVAGIEHVPGAGSKGAADDGSGG